MILSFRYFLSKLYYEKKSLEVLSTLGDFCVNMREKAYASFGWLVDIFHYI